MCPPSSIPPTPPTTGDCPGKGTQRMFFSADERGCSRIVSYHTPCNPPNLPPYLPLHPCPLRLSGALFGRLYKTFFNIQVMCCWFQVRFTADPDPSSPSPTPAPVSRQSFMIKSSQIYLHSSVRGPNFLFIFIEDKI